MGCLVPYEPLNTLKAVAPDVWIVDGPEIAMTWLKAPFTTRATVVRIEGGLWVHSPTPLTGGLLAELAALGEVRWIVSPNCLHHTWAAPWRTHFPHAALYAAPGRRPDDLHGAETLCDTPPAQWSGAFEQWIVPGDLFTEVVMLHRATGTLILTDLIENYEPSRVRCIGWRWIVQTFGAADPDGSAPFDMRLSFWRHRVALRQAVRAMIAAEPERVILSHGRWYPQNAEAELRRAFRWVLGPQRSSARMAISNMNEPSSSSSS